MTLVASASSRPAIPEEDVFPPERDEDIEARRVHVAGRLRCADTSPRTAVWSSWKIVLTWGVAHRLVLASVDGVAHDEVKLLLPMRHHTLKPITQECLIICLSAVWPHPTAGYARRRFRTLQPSRSLREGHALAAHFSHWRPSCEAGAGTHRSLACPDARRAHLRPGDGRVHAG
jgi:hypothetical protein